ncbi:uncharacterized protein LOC142639628 [Castanea sativa]|uniref:uncharacterized protein LOC142639628 n=1 Tax=Castanea sativa TaxID=21020 RepID=UPI003F64969D
MARALKFQSNVPLYLWGDCVLTVVHIINRLPSPILQNKSPFEKLYHSLFPFVFPSVGSYLVPSSSFLAIELIPSFTPSNTNLITPVETVLVADPIPPVAIVPLVIPTSFVPTPSTDDVAPASLSIVDFVEPVTSNPLIRRSHRIIKPPSYLQSYKCSSNACDKFAHSNPANNFCLYPTKSSTQYPLSNYLDSSKLSPSNAHFCSLITDVIKPKFYHEAVNDPRWQEAMYVEIAALEANHTWTLTPLSPNKKSICCKWVCKVKYKLDGSVERYKAKLVAKGFTQQEGLDFTETFSLVAKMATVKTLLAISAVRG